MCPPWLKLSSKGEAGYFDPFDTPGFMGDRYKLILLSAEGWLRRPKTDYLLSQGFVGPGGLGMAHAPPLVFVVVVLVALICVCDGGDGVVAVLVSLPVVGVAIVAIG